MSMTMWDAQTLLSGSNSQGFDFGLSRTLCEWMCLYAPTKKEDREGDL